ncbi:MAG: FtsW/RodA/SpoVE family cell cycle protein [Nitrospirae bacterium]|nr:FtsW/RodA/SpoVE family cell cycle protein [Nitrospirota bacterium]
MLYLTPNDSPYIRIGNTLSRVGAIAPVSKKMTMDFVNLLPAANTHFIFSFTAQHYGLAGIILMLTVCLGFFYFAVRATMKARSRFEATLTFLLAVMCMVMNVISIFVSLGLLPTMGFPMPFFSFGGDTVVLGFLTAGTIYRQLRHEVAEQNLLHLRSRKIMTIALGFCLLALFRATDVVYHWMLL